MHHEPVFIRTMIDCHSNQKGSAFSYLIFLQLVIHSFAEPYVNQHYRFYVDHFEYRSLHSLSITLCVCVFLFDIYIPFSKEFILVFPLFVRKYEKNQHENTQTQDIGKHVPHVMLMLMLMFKVQAVHHLGQYNWWVCPTNNN